MPEMRADFTGDTSQLSQKIRGIESQFASFGRKMEGMFGGAMVAGFATKLMAAAESVSSLADSTGLSPQFINSFRALADVVGPEKADQTIGKMLQTIDEALADAGGASAKKMAALKVNLKEIKALNSEDRFMAVARAMASVNDEAGKAAVGDMVGKSRRLVGIMQELAALGKEGMVAKFRFEVPTDEDVAKVKGLNDVWERMKRIGEKKGMEALAVPATIAPAGFFRSENVSGGMDMSQMGMAVSLWRAMLAALNDIKNKPAGMAP
jgi:hypothetical protein